MYFFSVVILSKAESRECFHSSHASSDSALHKGQASPFIVSLMIGRSPVNFNPLVAPGVEMKTATTMIMIQC